MAQVSKPAIQQAWKPALRVRPRANEWWQATRGASSRPRWGAEIYSGGKPRGAFPGLVSFRTFGGERRFTSRSKKFSEKSGDAEGLFSV